VPPDHYPPLGGHPRRGDHPDRRPGHGRGGPHVSGVAVGKPRGRLKPNPVLRGNREASGRHDSPPPSVAPGALSAPIGPSLLGRAFSMGTTIATAPLAMLPRLHRAEPDWAKVVLQPGPDGHSAYDATQLLALVHKGIPTARRREVWPVLAGVEALLKKRPKLVFYALQKTFPLTLAACNENVDEALQKAPARHPPFFKGLQPFMNVDLTTAQVQATKVLLCMLAQSHSHVEYCPSLPTLVAFLVAHVDAKVAYAIAHNVLAVSTAATHHAVPADGRCRFLATSAPIQEEDIATFDTVVQRKLPAVHRHGTLLKGDFAQLARDWFPNLFAGTVPPETALQIFDVFLLEGAYTHFLVGLAILKITERTFLMHQSWGAAVRAVRQAAGMLAGDVLLREAFGLHLSREELDACAVKPSKLSPPSLFILDGVYFRPLIEPPSRILTEGMWEAVFYWLPRAAAVSALTLQYSTSRDGFSLTTLYSKGASVAGACVLLCKVTPIPEGRLGAAAPAAVAVGETPAEAVFGAYLPRAPHISHTYYGDESCFVFSLNPKEMQYPAIHPTDSLLLSASPSVDTPHSDSSKATTQSQGGGNDYYMNGYHDRFLIGGGGSGPAIQLASDLQSGTSYASATFGNPALPGTSAFGILCLELYSCS